MAQQQRDCQKRTDQQADMQQNQASVRNVADKEQLDTGMADEANKQAQDADTHTLGALCVLYYLNANCNLIVQVSVKLTLF